MAESVKMMDLELTLKPFYQRAAEAEERLSRLEATLNNKADAGNEENTKVINDLQSKLNAANAEIISEKEKIRTLAEENAKLQYRIIHLVRSLKGANLKFEQATAHEQLQRMKL